MPQIAVVTGYSSGLGFCISEQLLARGLTVVGVARRTSAGELIERYPGRVVHVSGSVAEDGTADAAFAAAHAHGDIRLVVNCAGSGHFGSVGSHSAAEIRATLDANLAGLILFSDRAVRHMRANGGDIVNIMSTTSKKLRPAEPVYTAAKWGAKAYTRTLREAVVAERLRIRVFEIYPCGMNTRFWQRAIHSPSDGAGFPAPAPIASRIVEAISAESDSYPLEMTFGRG